MTGTVNKDERRFFILVHFNLFLNFHHYFSEPRVNFLKACIYEVRRVLLRNVHHRYERVDIDEVVLHVRDVLLLSMLVLLKCLVEKIVFLIDQDDRKFERMVASAALACV